MYIIKHVMTGRYLDASGSWTRDKAKASRFAQYARAFSARPLGGIVVEV